MNFRKLAKRIAQRRKETDALVDALMKEIISGYSVPRILPKKNGLSASISAETIKQI